MAFTINKTTGQYSDTEPTIELPQGFTGIQGIQGLQGLTGVEGFQGSTGVMGLEGITGAQGPVGLTGLQGSTGTGVIGGYGVLALSNLTTRTASIDRGWTNVAWGEADLLFAAVANTGTGNRVMTSSDGITWTTRYSPADIIWTYIEYGNGIFCASISFSLNVPAGGWGMYSTNGATWTRANISVYGTGVADPDTTVSGATQVGQLAFGNGIFVIAFGNAVLTSTDGFTWTNRSGSTPSTSINLSFGDNYFYRSSLSNASSAYTSTDGITWTATNPTPTHNQLNGTKGLAIGNGTIVLQNGNYSTDSGVTWTANTLPFSTNNMQYANGIFYYLGTDQIAISNNGIDWVTRSTPSGTWGLGSYGTGKIVAVGGSGTARVITSLNF